MKLPTLDTFAREPRAALMWVPRALDVARIAAACRVAGSVVADVGAGTGLLAHLLEKEGVAVAAYDPAPPATRYHPVEPLDADALPDTFDAAIVSWMEAGKDYREGVAGIAPVVVNAYDVEGGCGVMGQVDFAQYGYKVAASWRTPSFEDALFAVERPGRGVRRSGHPGNQVDVLTRKVHLLDALRDAVSAAKPAAPLAWERDMDRLGL